MSKTKLIIVGGPDSPATMAAGMRLMKQGYVVYFAQPCRMSFTAYSNLLILMNEDNQWRMRWNMNDVEMIKRADGMYMCLGWNQIDICKMQMNLAKELGKQILFEGVAEPREAVIE